MRKKGFKGRCEKRMIGKCKTVCRTYDPLQSAYAARLQENRNIREIQCNVPILYYNIKRIVKRFPFTNQRCSNAH